MDLPHKPSTPEELFDKTCTVVNDFAIELESKLMSLDFRVKVKKRKYGACVEFVLLPLNFCRCTESDCLQGQYSLSDQIFRVKSDWGFEAFQYWLASVKRFADAFDRSE